MALEARKGCKRVNIGKGLKGYTFLGCPLTRNRTPWCFRLCRPNADGTGFCGRVAPHGFKSRIQQGIEDYNKKRAESSTPPGNQEPACSKDS